MIDIINHSAVLTHEVAVMLEKESPLRAGLSPYFKRETIPTNMVSTLIKKNHNFISFDVVNYGEGTYSENSKIQENLYKAPVYEHKYAFDNDGLYMTTVAKGLMNNAPVNSQIAQKALNAMRADKNKIERAVLKQQWDFAKNGIVALKNNDNIDFKRSADSIVNITTASGYGGVYWNNSATAKPLTDYQKAGFYLRNIAFSTARTFYSIMSSSTYNRLAQVVEIKDILESRRANRAELNMPEIDLVAGMAYQGVLSTTDFEVIIVTYDDFYTDPTTLAKVPFLAEDLVVNIPTDFSGKTIFAALRTKGTTNLGVEANIPALVEAEYAMRSFWDDMSITGGMILNSSPIVIPVDVDLIHTMKVLA